MKPRILVVGSLVMDLIVTTERFCEAGETVLGTGFSTAPGGKGANQAVQAARLGADVTMVGKVGTDDFGKRLTGSLRDSGVDVSHIGISGTAPSAVGNVQIQKNEKGTENRIIVVSGANSEMSVGDVQFLRDCVKEYDMVILQNEIPLDVDLEVARIAHSAGVPVMLNPAPAAELPEEIFPLLTYIAPNEHETEALVGFEPVDDDSVRRAAEALRSLGVANAMITLGKRGCAYDDGKGLVISPSVNVAPVTDPTAAGDSFIGAFCTATAEGMEPKKALRFANVTAGITVTRMGAQTSLPTRGEVEKIMREKGIG